MADTTNTAEILIVADASGVEAGLRQASNAAERAEQAITSGANSSARSQQSLIGSIQRATAALEAGTRSGSRYYEVLAQQRGVDPRVLEPYLQQLRAVEQAQLRARGSTNGNTSSLNELGMSAGQTAAALQQVPAQITDIITSLQGGQSPLTVLIQQGGQLTDAFGSVEAALRAVGNQVMRMITPYTVAAAALAVLGVAYYQGSEEADAFRNSLAQSGNAVGASVDQLGDLAAAMVKVGTTQGAASEALVALVDAGNVPAERLQRFAAVSIDLQRALGRSVADTAQEFASLGERPVAAVEQLNGKYHFLTAAVYEQIRALESQGLKEEAAALAQNTYAAAMDERTKGVLKNLGYMEARWKELGDFAAKAWDKMLAVGRADTTQERLGDLQKDLAGIDRNLAIAAARGDTYAGRRLAALRATTQAEIAALQVTDEANKAAAKADADAAQMAEARIKWRGEDARYLSKAAQLERDITKARNEGAAAGVAAAEIEKRVAAIRKSYLQGDWDAAAKKREDQIKREAALTAELAGLTSSFADDWKLLSAQYSKGALSLDQLTDAQAKLLANQPGIKKYNEEQIKAQAESGKLYDQGIKTAEQYRDSLLEQLGAQRQNNEVIGLSAEAAADLQARRLEDAAALKEQTAASLDAVEPGSQVAKLYREQAAALRDLASAKSEGARKQIAADSAKQAADDWKRAAESIEQSLTDALLRGFESGKSFGRNLVDTLKNMFSTLVLRPVIQGVMAPVTGALVGGMPGAAQAAGGAGSTLSAASSLGGMAGLFGAGGLTGSLAAGAGWLTGATTLGGSLAAAGSLAATGSLAGIASSIGMAAGALGPIALGIGAAAALFKSAFGMKDKKYADTSSLVGSIGGSGFAGTVNTAWTQEGGWFRSDKSDVDRAPVNADMAKGLHAGYDAIKAASADFAKTLGINADFIVTRAQAVNIALGKDEAANQKAIADFFIGVGNTIAGELLPSLSQFQQDGEQASATLQRLATGYALVDTALTSIGMTFGAVGTSSLEARERLLAAAGGLDAFAANTAGFQQNFLSEAERNAPVLKSVTEQLAAMGLSSVDTRDEFKAVVLGLDLTTEAGAKQYGSLMKLQAAFAQVYPVIEKTATAAEIAATKLAEVNKPYLDQIRDLELSMMSATDRRAAEIAGMDASTVALYDRVAALTKEASAAQERLGLQDRLDSMTMTTAQLREKEIAKLDESNQAILRNIFAIEDSRAALEAEAVARRDSIQAAKDNAANLLSGVDSAFSVLQSVVGREKSLLQDTANAHRALSESLRGTLDSMSVPGQEREDRAGAQAQIRAALAIAKASGVLPDADKLRSALSTVGKDSASLFSTQEEYLRDFYSTQADIADLAGLTDKTLSVEEQSIKRLDGILESAQQELNALKGIDTSVFSLAEAIRGWKVGLGAAQDDPVASAGGSIADLYKKLLGRPADAAGLSFYKDRMAEGVTLDAIRKAIMESVEYKAGKKIPGFDSGGDHAGGLRWVGETRPELEATGPSRIHTARSLMDALRNPSNGNDALVAEVRALREEVGRLRSDARRGADAAEKTADSTEQLAEQFDNATDGGNAMRADVFNVVKTKEMV